MSSALTLPVEALGCLDDWWFYRDARGCLVALTTRRHGRVSILMLFDNNIAWLRRHWPKGARDWDHWRASAALMRACAHAGVIDPSKLGFRLTPRGAWRPDARPDDLAI